MALSVITLPFLTGCKDKATTKSSIITEVYEVDNGANNDYAKGSLKYMEHENFKGDEMYEKTFYNPDQTVKGKEVYVYSGNSKYPSGSKFYDPTGMLLSTYKYTYQDSLKTFAHAYEGDTETLLRIEGFQYDNKGNMVRKVIYNDLNQKQKSFRFGHDNFGNEIKMVLTDENDKLILSETYEIVTVDEKKRWIEKYGYVNDNSDPSTFYHKRRSTY